MLQQEPARRGFNVPTQRFKYLGHRMASCDHLKKLLFAGKQCLRALRVPDLITHGVPANDLARLVAVRNATTLEPSIDAIVPAEARFEPVWLAGGSRAGEDLQRLGAILRMDGVVRPPVLQPLQLLSEIGRDRAVDELQFAGRRHEQDDAGNRSTTGREAVSLSRRALPASRRSCFTIVSYASSARCACFRSTGVAAASIVVRFPNCNRSRITMRTVPTKVDET